LARYPRYREFRGLDALPIYEEMIASGAWWDYVDAIATRNLGELLRRHPREMAQTLSEWAVSDNLWKRRGALIAQLSFRRDTDCAATKRR
jgi:3-methyladenine DNA glycosylase AlkD